MAKKRKGKSKSSPEKVSADVRAVTAVRLRIEGKNLADIAKALGLATAQSALDCMRRGMAMLRPPQEAEELRAVEVERLEALHEKLWPNGDDPKVAGQIIKAVERRAKLLGLDAAIDVNLKGKIDHAKSIMDLDDEGLAAFITALGGVNGSGEQSAGGSDSSGRGGESPSPPLP